MSLSAHGTVLLGVILPEEYLQVRGPLERVCPDDVKHEITDKAYCPCCGNCIIDRRNWNPSPIVQAYANKMQTSTDNALLQLLRYVYRAPRQNFTLFGIELTSAGTNRTNICSLDKIQEGTTLLRPLLIDIGLDPNDLALHLFVEMH